MNRAENTGRHKLESFLSLKCTELSATRLVISLEVIIVRQLSTEFCGVRIK